MASYRLTRNAQSDLIEIRRYTVQQWGAAQSQKYLSELRKTIILLADTPTLGKPRPEVGEKVLSFPYAGHVVYYLVHKRSLVIFAVLHKQMVPNNHSAERPLFD